MDFGSFRGSGALYEFDLADGSRVCLHELDCIGVQYIPQPPPRLVLDFEANPDHPPMVETVMSVRLTFRDATVTHWADDRDLNTDAARAAAGQVGDLSWDGHNRFLLELLAVSVYFEATSVVAKRR